MRNPMQPENGSIEWLQAKVILWQRGRVIAAQQLALAQEMVTEADHWLTHYRQRLAEVEAVQDA